MTRAHAFFLRSRPFVVPLALLTIWEITAHSGHVDHKFLPSLEDVASRGWAEMRGGDLGLDLLASLERDIMGFVVGALAGVLLGIVIGFSSTAQRLLGPTLVAHRQIALFAWIPLLSAWFGGGQDGKLAFIALAAFQPTLMNTWRGVANIPAQYRELAAVLTFSRLDFVRTIALPGALPEIFVGLQSAMIYAWVATIGAELLLDIAPGLGGRMNEGQQLFEMDLLLFYLFVLGAVGVTFSLLALRLESHLLRWRVR